MNFLGECLDQLPDETERLPHPIAGNGLCSCFMPIQLRTTLASCIPAQFRSINSKAARNALVEIG